MQTVFDADDQRLNLVFETEDEMQSYLANIRSRGLFLIRLPEAPAAQQRVSVRIQGGGTEILVESEVHQVFRSGATEHGVALRPLTEIPDTTEPVDEPATEETPEAEPEVTAEGSTQKTEMTGAAIALEIRRMNVSQRIRLATRAGRLERQILLRDNSPQVLLGLTANPRIDEQEVRDLVRSPHAASGVLQHVAKDRRWSANYEIRLALVRNPKTPTPLAQRLLTTLRTPDLQILAKSPNVREAIKGAALRLYLGKV